jgi:integrase/recombinase XerD
MHREARRTRARKSSNFCKGCPDLQRYADALAGAPATRARRLRALKSLLSVAAKIGYLPFNVGAAIRGPRLEHTLAERILSEQQVLHLTQ